jgi:hypothetical protein
VIKAGCFEALADRVDVGRDGCAQVLHTDIDRSDGRKESVVTAEGSTVGRDQAGSPWRRLSWQTMMEVDSEATDRGTSA